ncbi:Protein of unknown function [Micromonospora lupini str. Lupac 08]|uniref:Uncharacterized protein n=1 Tax=Micromonospora lupini str. Lupac 08 TaxID=1150864 RepID=I0L1K4_9ACTN|nr:Protein of unknown function [Micromonospora lupini str. Lupac 08]
MGQASRRPDTGTRPSRRPATVRREVRRPRGQMLRSILIHISPGRSPYPHSLRPRRYRGSLVGRGSPGPRRPRAWAARTSADTPPTDQRGGRR